MFFMVNWVIFTENIDGHLKDQDSGLGGKKLRFHGIRNTNLNEALYIMCLTVLFKNGYPIHFFDLLLPLLEDLDQGYGVPVQI